jgi:hypothetical protein
MLKFVSLPDFETRVNLLDVRFAAANESIESLLYLEDAKTIYAVAAQSVIVCGAVEAFQTAMIHVKDSRQIRFNLALPVRQCCLEDFRQKARQLAEEREFACINNQTQVNVRTTTRSTGKSTRSVQRDA